MPRRLQRLSNLFLKRFMSAADWNLKSVSGSRLWMRLKNSARLWRKFLSASLSLWYRYTLSAISIATHSKTLRWPITALRFFINFALLSSKGVRSSRMPLCMEDDDDDDEVEDDDDDEELLLIILFFFVLLLSFVLSASPKHPWSWVPSVSRNTSRKTSPNKSEASEIVSIMPLRASKARAPSPSVISTAVSSATIFRIASLSPRSSFASRSSKPRNRPSYSLGWASTNSEA
mmetsp:Transcript_22662/g.45555  ORF Transcript_22662/g.45555 Transcript_22662/m.45555 type:complete len:232 (-) Transcript_22662:494-1189(-)